MATYLRGRESGGPFVFEYRLLARDGRTVWFRDSAIVLTDAHGRAEHIQGVMLDITDGKLAEERIAFLAYHDRSRGFPTARCSTSSSVSRSPGRSGTPRCGGRDGGPRRLQARERLPRPRGRELPPCAVRAETLRRDPGNRPGRPARRRRVPAPALGPRSEPGGPRGHESVSVAAESVALGSRKPCGRRSRSGTPSCTSPRALASVSSPRTPPTRRRCSRTRRPRCSGRSAGGRAVRAPREGRRRLIVRLSMSTRLRRAVEQEQWMLHYQPLIDLASAEMIGVEA